VLGGSNVSTLLILTASDDAIGADERTGVAAAFAAAGREVCIVDARPVVDAEAQSLTALLDRVADGVEPGDLEGGGRLFADAIPATAAQRERLMPAVITALAAHADTVVLVADAGATSLAREVMRDGAGVVIAVRSGSTSASALSALVTKLSFTDVHPLGVLLTGAPVHTAGVVTETWHDADEVRPAATAR